MTELSPQAQAVLDAAFSAYWSAGQEAPNDAHVIAAAALRAAADQVVPGPNDIDIGSFSLAAIRNRCKVLDQLLAIAAELEGAMCDKSQGFYGLNSALSPTAQAVKDAVIALYTDQQQIRDWGWRLDAPTAAAALRAAADQVVPLHICGTNATRAQTRLGIRQQLLAIAAELEGNNG